MSGALLIACAGAVAVLVGTGLVRRYALARDLLDHPNARAAHEIPTPRGGGLAMVLVIVLGLLAGAALGLAPRSLALAVAGGGGMVAAIGFLDDHGDVAARWRLLVHVLACGLAIVLLGPVRDLELPGGALSLGPFATALSLLAGVSLVNFYNFMDGIDGIAGSELVCFSAGLLILVGAEGVLALPAWLGVAAGAAFLAWNWPPARIFMGDVGSGFLGFYLGTLLLAGVASGATSLWGPLLLLGVFVVDALVTLLVRAATGQRVSEAHSTHTFQHLARRFGHRAVTLATCAVNLCWLLPLALLAEATPAYGLALLALAWLPLVVLAIAVGAGRPRE
ncbi:MAG: glycosyltransferase family 4 protein [Pseudomonadales bacterium]|jgi:Fuc2NAc and GlcNAc transferase|nr:glycosyltransferase family 4 protein [Pseudomonadales bacterium]